MTPETMAAMHGRAFAWQGRGWAAEEFARLLASAHVFAVHREHGFALGRVVADEADLLTIAVEPAETGRGHGTALLAEFELVATDRGAIRAVLDVAADNAAAQALYRRAGYEQIARRRGYYARPAGSLVDALIFEKILPAQAMKGRQT